MNPKLFADMKDFFCYVQLERGASSLTSTVPVEDVAALCRALGFFPTDREIEDMVNEVRYSNYVNTGQLQTEIRPRIVKRKLTTILPLTKLLFTIFRPVVYWQKSH